ncbi:hypothetical protein QR680_015319 [Steinernema hermaphroditum]|uniref:Protein kinase domain-containing protein n=1 Tax=Steinernema hermaphroditum TaxID=289476 RepID=A0AA39LKM8_9BILA|nr:hypothetical protein QR680_015319 [Steinernema hermaphroditum]
MGTRKSRPTLSPESPKDRRKEKMKKRKKEERSKLRKKSDDSGKSGESGSGSEASRSESSGKDAESNRSKSRARKRIVDNKRNDNKRKSDRKKSDNVSKCSKYKSKERTSENHTKKVKPKDQVLLDEKNKLKAGTTLTASFLQVTVLKMLGSGGFGDVYLVKDSNDAQYAMKTEYKQEGISSRMKIEVRAYDFVMRARSKTPEAVMHLLGFFGTGAVGELKYFVMSLVGPCVEELATKTDLTWSSALRLIAQMFDGLVELHKLGFVHRDIKTANYSVGLREQNQHRRIFLMDLGMVCKVIRDPAKMPMASKYDFIGTLLYAPRISHLGGVQTRKDDLESWLYTSLDIIAPDNMPWAIESERERVFELKQEFFKKPTEFYKGHWQFVEIMDMIDKLGVFDTPDYEGIRKLIESAGKDESIDIDNVEMPFDWELPEYQTARATGRFLRKHNGTNVKPAELQE